MEEVSIVGIDLAKQVFSNSRRSSRWPGFVSLLHRTVSMPNSLTPRICDITRQRHPA